MQRENHRHRGVGRFPSGSLRGSWVPRRPRATTHAFDPTSTHSPTSLGSRPDVRAHRLALLHATTTAKSAPMAPSSQPTLWRGRLCEMSAPTTANAATAGTKPSVNARLFPALDDEASLLMCSATAKRDADGQETAGDDEEGDRCPRPGPAHGASVRSHTDTCVGCIVSTAAWCSPCAISSRSTLSLRSAVNIATVRTAS